MNLTIKTIQRNRMDLSKGDILAFKSEGLEKMAGFKGLNNQDYAYIGERRYEAVLKSGKNQGSE
jgi:hypothetical protein